MIEALPFGGTEYLVLLSVLLFARAMDFLSTWIATPNLLLEANPIARKLGWRWGIPVNVVLCMGFAFLPLSAIIIATTSVLVAARNFQSAWLMRSSGEEGYRSWMGAKLAETSSALFLFCLLAQAVLVSLVGVALLLFGGATVVVTGIGIGVIVYAVAVVLFTLIALRRTRIQY